MTGCEEGNKKRPRVPPEPSLRVRIKRDDSHTSQVDSGCDRFFAFTNLDFHPIVRRCIENFPRVETADWRLWGRERPDYTARYPELEVLRRLPARTLVDGELVAFDADGRPDLPRLLRRYGLTDPSRLASPAPGAGRLHGPLPGTGSSA